MAKQKRRKDGRLQKSFLYDGKRYYVYGRDKAELEEKEKAKKEELTNGLRERINPTLDDYYERFTKYRRSKVKESTIRCQSFQFRNCADIVIDGNGKTLGKHRIADIKPYDIQTVQAKLEESGRSTETVNNCMAHLSHVFNAAVRDETIVRNPCKCIERVKRTERPARETIHRALTEAETKAFFAGAKESYYINHFRLMLQTGIRVGELGAITPFDVDTKNKELRINKTITKDEIGAYIIGDTPKTDAGNREIQITDKIIAFIKDQQQVNRLAYTDQSKNTIFRSAEGMLLREYMINREIKRICKNVGIEKFTCHAFRATFATRFIEKRPQDYKVLSEILGHSNTKITLDLYTHVMKDKKREAMEAIEIAM